MISKKPQIQTISDNPKGCTVGALFLPGRVLLFKNRDLSNQYITRHIYTFKNYRALRGVNLENGCPEGVSIGVNRHGIGVANTHVASTPEMAYDMLCEEILLRAQTRHDVPRIAESFVRRNALQGGRILVVSILWGYLIEVYGNIFRIKALRGNCAITNHFSLISCQSTGAKSPRCAREITANMLLKNAKRIEDVKSLLRSHIPHKDGNSICRHGEASLTESSHIISIRAGNVTWASLAGNPCENDYQALDIFS